jgi:hypothetical protein
MMKIAEQGCYDYKLHLTFTTEVNIFTSTYDLAIDEN